MPSRIPLAPSPPGWIAAARAELEVVLVDHAHCEKKAAATALRLLARHPDWPGLAPRMSRLAREELVHFERVLDELGRRGIRFRNQPSAGYAAALLEAARDVSDTMIACALIEARSHERFGLLARAVAGDDARLAALYDDLGAAEERHGAIYLELAAEAAGRDPSPRLAELAAHEARVVARPGQPVRMHAGGVAAERS